MNDPSPARSERQLFGHPLGLMTLFFTELWERFSYYGMRAILMLFMTASAATGGLGWDNDRAGAVYAMYTGLVYMASLPGGWLADRFLGQRKAVLWGGVIIMIGHIALAMHGLAFFFGGLFAIVVGTGLLKPNISAMVGQLYEDGDARRDAGFSIFYMGINLGAFLAPLVCGWLAQHEDFRVMLDGWGMDPNGAWHWGFGAAAVGMGLGLIQYVWGANNLHERSSRPAPSTPEEHESAKKTLMIGLVGVLALVAVLIGVHTSGIYELNEGRISTGFGILLGIVCVSFFAWLFSGSSWTPAERKNLTVIFVLFCGSSVFWSCFEQAGSTLNLFADQSTENVVLGYEYPASWFQSLNALFIVALAPVFAWMWVALKNRDPSSPAKFSLGILLVGAGFAVLSVGAAFSRNGVLVSPWWLFFTYLLHTVGELCLSPVGLSAMTKLAPQRVVGLMMGVWFLSTSVGNWLGGTIARFYGDSSGEGEGAGDPSTMFAYIAGFSILVAIIMAFFVKPIRRMLEAKH